MFDPAIEAAKHAIPVPVPLWMLDEKIIGELGAYGEAAAREALKPIRALVESWEEFGDEPDLDDLKRLIYSTEELQ